MQQDVWHLTQSLSEWIPGRSRSGLFADPKPAVRTFLLPPRATVEGRGWLTSCHGTHIFPLKINVKKSMITQHRLYKTASSPKVAEGRGLGAVSFLWRDGLRETSPCSSVQMDGLVLGSSRGKPREPLQVNLGTLSARMSKNRLGCCGRELLVTRASRALCVALLGHSAGIRVKRNLQVLTGTLRQSRSPPRPGLCSC